MADQVECGQGPVWGHDGHEELSVGMREEEILNTVRVFSHLQTLNLNKCQ